MRSTSLFLIGCLVTVLLFTATTNADTRKNILFYGNSFTIGQGSTEVTSLGGLPGIVRDLATAAGFPAPNVENAASSGQTLTWHIGNNTAVISNPQDFVPEPGFQWDHVVLQDFSTRPTHIGDRGQHRSDVVGMTAIVQMHSPGVLPILYETWARHPNHSIYAGSSPDFPGGPAQMQQELREGYAISAIDLLYVYGLDTPIAPVGDAWELTQWDNLHATDLYHAGTRGSYLAGLVIYGTIYNQSVVGLPKLFDSMTEAEALTLQTIADQVIPMPTGFNGPDCNYNNIPDDREADCNGNGIPDDCDLTEGTSLDCDEDDIPDECTLMPVPMWSDDFDTDSSASWSIIKSGNGDIATFSFDYSTVGIPSAPNSDGTTIGLKLEANTPAGPADTTGLSVYPTNITFNGNVFLEFDMYISFDRPYSTEHASAGLFHDGTRLNASSNVSMDTDGIFFAVDGDGGMGEGTFPTTDTIRDYNGYKGIAGSAAQRLDIPHWDRSQPPTQAFFPVVSGDPIGDSYAGAVGRQWVHAELIQQNDTITWKINGHTLYEGSNEAGSGTLMLGYFDAVAAQNTTGNTFVLFDNVRLYSLAGETGRLAQCMTGPEHFEYIEDICCAADIDEDGDVDLADYALLQASYEPPTPVLTADPISLSFTLVQEEMDSDHVTITADNGTTPNLTLEAIDPDTQQSPSWLLIPGSAAAGTSITIGADSAGLATGSYVAEVTASADGYSPATFTVTMEVTPPSAIGDMLIDFGIYTNETSGQPRFWNNVTNTNMYNVIPIRTIDDLPSGISLRFPDSQWFTGANTSGTTAATSGSNLESLGYPASVLADSLFGNDVEFSGAIHETAVIELSGMNPSLSYDFVFTASRMGAGDTRTTDYEVAGKTTQTATLNASNNTTEYVSVSGIAPDASGMILISVSKGATNNNSYGFFYLGVMEIRPITE